jgi:hypothetical protein
LSFRFLVALPPGPEVDLERHLRALLADALARLVGSLKVIVFVLPPAIVSDLAASVRLLGARAQPRLALADRR